MSLHIFCQDCGDKIEYTDRKPNFCPSCRFPFNPEAKARLIERQSAPPRQVLPTKKVTPILEVEGDDDEPVTKPSREVTASGLDFEIEPDERRSTPIEALFGTGDGRVERRNAPPRVSKKQFLKDFAREAGPCKREG